MHYSAEAIGSLENLVQYGERSRNKVSLDDFTVRDLAAEQREAQELQRARERQVQEQKRAREAAERGYRREIIGDFVLAKPTVMHANGQDYAVPAGRHADVGEISIVDGELHRAGVVYQVQDNAASIVSLIEQRDLVRAYRDGKIEVHPGPPAHDGQGDPRAFPARPDRRNVDRGIGAIPHSDSRAG